MSDWNLPIGVAFDRMSDPVFLLKDNQIAYLNPAAAACFADLAVDSAPPEEFSLLAPDCAASLTLNGRSWSALLWPCGEGELVQLTPADESSLLPDRRVPFLVRQLRSPLSALIYCGESVERVLSPEQMERVEKPLARSHKAQARLMRAFRMLDLAALPEGEEPYDFHLQPADLTGLLNETVHQLSDPLSELNCQLRFVNNTRNLCAYCDDHLLQTLIYHLVSNALRAMGRDGEITLRLEQRRDLALISVEDNGPGMTAQQLSTLFAPAEGGESLADPFHGLGLGITAARKIAQLHGGSLVLANRPERGVRATFSLKLCSPGAPMALHSPRLADSGNGLPLVLRELSDVLPEACYRLESN